MATHSLYWHFIKRALIDHAKALAWTLLGLLVVGYVLSAVWAVGRSVEVLRQLDALTGGALLGGGA